jgi:FAD dependent oxidoreductase
VVLELAERTADGDLRAAELLARESNAAVFLEHTVFDAATDGTCVTSVDARDARSGREGRFRARVFIDCTGKALLGLLTGAETLFGQESRAEFSEDLAPDNRVDAHHGHTVFFRTRMAEAPVPFPDVPWAREVAKDFANLNGQLVKPGVDNGPGPMAGPARVPDPNVRRRMLFPASHFWEYGQWLDPYTQEEHIRDHLLCAIYGTFSNVKRLEPNTYANLELEWVAHVAARGEYRRYLGDYILTETDIRNHQEFPDAVVYNSGAFCLHYADDEKDAKYDFRLKDWKWDTRDGQPYEIPFRCLYSATIPNVMMAGKHISVTHVAGSTTKFMANGAHHAIATAAAAFLCTKYGTTPRGVYEAHLRELQEITGNITGKNLGQQHHANARP